MPTAPFPIVGIGASAGGVEALEGFFSGMPAPVHAAFVIVTHLSPERESLLHQVIARYTEMPVQVAANGDLVEAGRVYVLPSSAILGMAGGRLKVTPLESGQRERRPVDIFLSALAMDQGENAAGVILSGGDGDGALGVKMIKECGGLTFAQTADGNPPSHPSMPQSAIATGMVDLAIPVTEMGERIAEFARSLAVLDEASAGEGGERALSDARQDLYGILRHRTGHDFSGYKSRTFLRRVQRRMQAVQLPAIDDYVERLRQDPKEVTALFRDLLISVTNFFRDADAFETLQREVIPRLFEGRGAADVVRVWVPGCATGEEVFSIAILMREHMDTLGATPRVQVFATDIDESAIGVARAGRYPAPLLDGVSPERLRRFFVADGGSYLVSKDVRDLCIFSAHSVIRDPPFSRMDLISCRNLLIYFGPDIQDQVIPLFHYALKPEGYLFLGTSENASQFADLFIPLDKKSRLFRSRADTAARIRVPLQVGEMRPVAMRGAKTTVRGAGGAALREAVEAQVLERFAPAHVVVTADGDVVYYSSGTGKYLEAAPGAPSRQLLSLARKELRLDLRTLLREAVESRGPASRERVLVENAGDRLQPVTLTVEPLALQAEGEPQFLVLFEEDGPSIARADVADRRGAADEATLHLERELRDNRERLQSLIEEYETALEELRSSNEELVSVNEELQSTNEELQSTNEEFEASKEELQSLNEELQTVNLELNSKIEALDQSNGDLQNLFESTEVATVFLDDHLVIRSFTPPVARIFKILPGDQGRPLTDLTGTLILPKLKDDVQAVFSGGAAMERRVGQIEGEGQFLMRLVPYRLDGRIEGVVATFVDVTSLTHAEAQLRVLVAELNHRVKNMLTVVLGIAQQTLRSTSSTAEFERAFVDRLLAMARSYELLSRENWSEAPLGDLVRQELAPFGLERVDLAGAPLRLKPTRGLAMGMILHELATNAAKYGALSVPDGRVAVNWTAGIYGVPGSEVVLEWRESGGPAAAAPERRGFGLKLVERETSYNLGGAATMQFLPDGLAVTLRFPRGEALQDPSPPAEVEVAV